LVDPREREVSMMEEPQLERPRTESVGDAHALVGRATALFAAGRIADCQALFERARASDGRCVEAHYGLGLLALARGELAAAKAAFEQVVDLDSRHANTLYHLGLIAEAEHQSEQAGHLYHHALRIYPGHRQAQRRLDKLGGRPGVTSHE
jgi:tetratricopeptide (TPR) repeat protein